MEGHPRISQDFYCGIPSCHLAAGWVHSGPCSSTNADPTPIPLCGLLRALTTHLELLLQLGLQLPHPWRKLQAGRKVNGASQQHGVGAIEKLVPK